MPQTMRMFISLPVPQPVIKELHELQQELRARLRPDSVRWTRPEQIHLTLKFLGEVSGEKMNDVAETLRKTCAGFRPFNLRAERIGFFPGERLPRIIWASVRDEHYELLRLQRAVDAALSRLLGQSEEKDFTAHLTIGRSKNLKASDNEWLLKLAYAAVDRSFGNWEADAVQVMRSELSAGGGRYTCLVQIPLGDG